MGRKPGTSNKSNYHYKVEEYDTWKHETLVRKGYFKTQQDIQEFYNMNRAAVFHTMKGNGTRIKKYNFLKIEKLNPPLPIHEKIVIDYKQKHEDEINDLSDTSSMEYSSSSQSEYEDE